MSLYSILIRDLFIIAISDRFRKEGDNYYLDTTKLNNWKETEAMLSELISDEQNVARLKRLGYTIYCDNSGCRIIEVPNAVRGKIIIN